MKRIIRLLCLFLTGTCLTTGPLLADEPNGSDRSYRVATVEYEIDGRTRQWAIADLLEIQTGTVFQSRDDLDRFIERQRQVLINARVLQAAEISYKTIPVSDAAAGATVDVALRISVKDTWNLIVLPYFKYDSNTGLLLSLRARDYNFFGTMQELAIDFNYERTEEETNLFTIASEIRLPFNILQRRWELIAQESLELEDGDVDFEISTGLGYYFNWFNLDWQAIYTESYRYLTDDQENDNSFFTSRGDLASTIDLDIGVPGYGVLEYRPNIYGEVNYRPGGRMSKGRRGVSVGFEHALRAGDYDWIGNYRRGRIVEVGNDNTYNINKEQWEREITFETALYHPLWQPDPAVWPKAGVSTGFSAFYLMDGADEEQDDAAKAARGVLNDTMNGDLGLFLNLDAIVTFWTLEPIFEAQFGTFFDIAYVRDLRGDFYEKTSFDSKRDLRYGAGIEVIGFPLFARSLYIRGSLGFDLLAIADGEEPLSSKAREIFIGLGHHY